MELVGEGFQEELGFKTSLELGGLDMGYGRHKDDSLVVRKCYQQLWIRVALIMVFKGHGKFE